jgi:ribose 5-phosphate isomerase B
MNIAIGCDPNAANLKQIIAQHLITLGHEVVDYGSRDPIYANTAMEVAKAVSEGKHNRGILLCGTGIGMCLAANKVYGAYAVVCSDPYSVERSVKSNNANILTIGEKVIGSELAKMLVTIWLSIIYEPGGQSEPKIQRIVEIEKQSMNIES